ncbi:hypothetical protein K151_2004 [Proteus hauseri ZMd44]|nr:hypothetical protein K151_2004 [Proteus hauseri ZMd44]
MFLVYTIIVIAFFISLATIEPPDGEQVCFDINKKQIGHAYVV